MSKRELDGRRVLVVEDESVIAMELEMALSEAGAEVVGPRTSVASALAEIACAGRLDLAVLDINLRGVAAYPVADELQKRGIPFVLTTGYSAGEVTRQRGDMVAYLGKPVTMQQVTATLAQLADRYCPRTEHA